jgi:hypothetical protein
MHKAASLESRLIRALAVIGLIAVGGVLAILPYRLYERDIRHAWVDAHRLSSVVHVALSDALRGGDDVTDLVNRLQGLAEFQLRLRRLDEGEAHPAGSGRGALLRPFGTEFTYVAPPILDADGRTWLVEMQSDLSSVKRDSVRIITDLVIAVILGSLAFSVGIFLLVRRALIRPVEQLTRALEREGGRDSYEEFPQFATREMQDLARVAERTWRAASQ